MSYLTTSQIKHVTGWSYPKSLTFARDNGEQLVGMWMVERKTVSAMIQEGIITYYQMESRLSDLVSGYEVEEISNRDTEMARLRMKKGWTLEKIGKRFGVTRERVRQILGNTGTVASQMRHEKIRTADPMLTNKELADEHGVCLKTISNYREGWHVVDGDSPLASGNGWEKWAAEQLETRGHEVELQHLGSYFDILLDGKIKIDVKSAHGLIPKSLKGRLKNPRYSFQTRKRKDRKPIDFYFLIIAETKDIFIVPYDVLPEKKDTIIFVWPSDRPTLSKYSQYHNRYDLLEQS